VIYVLTISNWVENGYGTIACGLNQQKSNLQKMGGDRKGAVESNGKGYFQNFLAASVLWK
jgi:hypothetical protein